MELSQDKWLYSCDVLWLWSWKGPLDEDASCWCGVMFARPPCRFCAAVLFTRQRNLEPAALPVFASSSSTIFPSPMLLPSRRSTEWILWPSHVSFLPHMLVLPQAYHRVPDSQTACLRSLSSRQVLAANVIQVGTGSRCLSLQSHNTYSSDTIST